MIKDGIKFDSLDQEAGVYVNRANSKQQLGLQKEALEDYEMALKILPDSPEAYANRGILYDKQGDYEKAIHDYRRALKLKPELGEGPGIIKRVLFNIQEKPATIAGRLKFLEETSADAKPKETSAPDKKG
jgi:tetratricopeptide (TPR) repeat protein